MNKSSFDTTTSRGPGRPKKNEEDGMVRINVQVTAAEHQKLKIFCAVNTTTITDVVKSMIANLPT